MNPRPSFLRLRPLCTLIICLSALCMAASVPAQAASPASSSATLTTPALIDQAFTKGQITSDQRLLYLIYAIRDSSKLPAQFHSRAGWSATWPLREIKQAQQALKSGKGTFSPELRAALSAPSPQAATVCDTEDGANTLETTHFHIVYNTITTLTAQQYADALEETFGTEITSYGWAQPPFTSNNLFGRYPVQISDLGSGLYGYVTSPGGSYTGTVGDNPNTAATETSAIASCMVVNSDMTNFASTPEGALLALKVTMAHEFFHAVQYGNGDPGTEEAVVWYESTAAYVEDEVQPSSHDNYQYLYPDLTVSLPLQTAEGQKYSMWPLFRYAAEQNGGLNTAGGGEDLMGTMWANIGADQTAITAYNSALQAKGSNLNDTYHNFAISLRFLKSCASAAPYCFSDADNILSSRGSLPSNQGSIASIGGSYSGQIKNTYAANWVGLPTSGTYQIQLSNSATSGILHASVVADLGSSLSVTSLPALVAAGESSSLASYTVPSGATSVVLVISNQEISGDLSSPATASYTITTQASNIIYDNFTYLPIINS